MSGFFKSLKWLMSGEVLQTADVTIMGGLVNVSLRLKQEKGSPNVRYVIMANTARGNYQYYAFDREEFEQFALATQNIRAALVDYSNTPVSTNDQTEQKPTASANPFIGFLWFVAACAALFAIWRWNNGNLGFWAVPVVFGIATIPSLVKILLKR